MIIWTFAFVFAVLAFWAVWGREWLKKKPWAHGFFQMIEPVELYLWRKSETILFARLKTVVGVWLTVLAQFGQIDFAPLMPLIPERYRGVFTFVVNTIPLSLTILGLFDEKLRRETTKPLELVALKEEDVPLEIREAIIAAELAKRQAVAEVVTAKAIGEIQA